MTQSQPIRISRRGRNLIIRQVCSRYGEVFDHLVERHDGSPEGMIAAADRVSQRMFELYDDASNIASQIVATDERGLPRWTISPNFRVITKL
jgi:hypothetical protein